MHKINHRELRKDALRDLKGPAATIVGLVLGLVCCAGLLALISY